MKPLSRVVLAMALFTAGALVPAVPAHAAVAASAMAGDDGLVVPSLDDAADLGDGVVDATGTELAVLLEAADEADGQLIVVSGEGERLLGVVANPAPDADAELFDVIESVLGAESGVTLNAVDAVAVDADLIERRLRDVIATSERVLADQLATMPENPTAADLLSLQAKLQQWTMLAQLQSTISRESA